MTEETLQTPAATTNEGQPSPAQETEVRSEQTEVEQQPPEAKDEPEQPEQPETWDNFKLAAGEGSDEGDMALIGEAAKEQGFAPGAVQRMLDKVTPLLQERQLARTNEHIASWQETLKADKDFGGDKFEENSSLVQKFVDTYGSDEAKALFKPITEGGRGLKHHPEIAPMLLKAAKATLPETRIVKGQPMPAAVDDEAERLFPTMMRQMRERQRS